MKEPDHLPLNVLYLAHDLADAAIRRRVLTLKAGGANVTVAGFQRAGNVLGSEPCVTTIRLGRTADAQFGQRIGAVVSARMNLKRTLGGIARPDVVIARNLETLALASGAASLFGKKIPVVYECLDIHRLLLDNGPKGYLMRAAQRYFARDARLLITSSPAFVERFFKPRSGLGLPILMMENKVLELEAPALQQSMSPRPPEPGKPWRIGWFGAIRCRKSLDILIDFARRMDGKVEFVLRGRPAYSEFDDFEAQVKAAPHVEFHGSYRNPEELAAIYNDVQFTWAIDFFEEGQNSDWLLPNRLYEGGLHCAVPIALASTETGRFIGKRRIGIGLDRATPETLATLFESMTAARYAELFASLSSVERSQWVTGPADCHALVAKLAALHPNTPPPANVPAISTVQP